MKNNDKILEENCSNLGEIYCHFQYLFRPVHFQFCTKSPQHTNLFHRKLQIKANILIFFLLEGVTQMYLHRCTKLQPHHIFKYWKAGRKQQKLPNEETRVTKIRELHWYPYHYKKEYRDKFSNFILEIRTYKHTDQQHKTISCWNAKRFPDSFQPGTVPQLQSPFSKLDSNKTLAIMT